MRYMLKRLAHRFGYEVHRGGGPADAFAAQRALVSSPEPIVFDVGAYVGEMAWRYRRIFPRALIYCFEPAQDAFEKLERNTARDANVSCHRMALADREGLATLHINASPATNSLLGTYPGADRFWGPGKLETSSTTDVATGSIDHFCTEHSITRIDVMKIDVQGLEYAVLLGARQLMERHAVGLIYTELLIAPTYKGQRGLHEYLALMKSFDYELVDFFNLVHLDGRLAQLDGLFAASGLVR
jgi:FkbM family methyltransferase